MLRHVCDSQQHLSRQTDAKAAGICATEEGETYMIMWWMWHTREEIRVHYRLVTVAVAHHCDPIPSHIIQKCM